MLNNNGKNLKETYGQLKVVLQVTKVKLISKYVKDKH